MQIPNSTNTAKPIQTHTDCVSFGKKVIMNIQAPKNAISIQPTHRQAFGNRIMMCFLPRFLIFSLALLFSTPDKKAPTANDISTEAIKRIKNCILHPPVFRAYVRSQNHDKKSFYINQSCAARSAA